MRGEKMSFEIIKDRNAGNSPNTYWKASGDRVYCIKTDNDFLRNKSGKVRRFGTKISAQKVVDNIIK
jgi:hypothetical protein